MNSVFANWNKRKHQQTAPIRSCNNARLNCIDIPINHKINKTHYESRNDADEHTKNNESTKRTVSTKI